MVKKKKKCDNGIKSLCSSSSISPSYDKDTAFFISLSQELKEAGNQHFQIRDYEGAMLKYDKAIKLLPKNHSDVSYLRSNMAACHMQMGLTEYPSAIHQCNLALEVTPKYTKALLKRARCYEALNKLDLALRDVNSVSTIEPDNLMALEIAESVKKKLMNHEIKHLEKSIHVAPESIKTRVKARRKRSNTNTNTNKLEDNKAQDKVVVEEKIATFTQEEPKKTVKLVCDEDIRWAQLPQTCSLLHLREVISDRFPRSKAVLIKYRDPEGDLVTITTDNEIRLAETSSGDSQGSLRLYVVEVPPEQDPFFDKIRTYQFNKNTAAGENGSVGKCTTEKGSSYLDDWIIQFAQLFKNHVGFESDTYIDLHKLGTRLYSEAMEETVTSKEAQDLFDTAADKFQEMAALALFNCANVHMSKARKKVYFTEEDASKESQFLQIKTTFDWAQIEYSKAGNLYEESLKIKPDFHEAILALGQQQFEQAKLSWYYAIGSKVDLETWPSTEVLQLYNNAEDNMEKGMQMWEQSEERRRNDISRPSQIRTQLSKMGLEGSFKDISVDEASEQASNMRSQINLLWGTMLYERSIMEFKLELPVWQECFEVSVEKFELAGASATDIGVMIKNHCSNNNALEGLGFNIDEIIQAWNEMYEAKQWQNGVPSFRLEPLFRRRLPPIYHAWEHG